MAYSHYKAHAPDLVILDLSLRAQAVSRLSVISAMDGSARIVVFSMRTGAMIARQTFAAGASGYISKASHPPRELLSAVATVLRGERAMSADIARAIAQDEVAGGRTALDDLSPRELEILGLTAAG